MVLDCSVTLAWFLPEQEDGDFTSLLYKIASYEKKAFVPRIWAHEVHGSLPSKMRHHYIEKLKKSHAFTEGIIDETLRSLANLPIEIVPSTRVTLIDYTNELYPLAKGHGGVQFYDSSYLKLAMERSLPLATIDEKLAKAALSEGVGLVFSLEKIREWKDFIGSKRGKKD